MKLIPLEDRVIILQDEKKKETDTGLIIPETAQAKPSSGTVVSVGPGKPMSQNDKPIGYLINDVFFSSLEGMDFDIKDRIEAVYARPHLEGDKVFFSYYAGTPITFEGKEYLVMRFSDLISRL